MKRPRSQNQLALFLVVTAILVLALYGVHTFEPSLRTYFMERMTHAAPDDAEARADFNAILRIIKLVLWTGLIIVLVRAFSAAVFKLAFRLRKGTEAPGLIRNIFSIIAVTILFFIAFGRIYPEVNLGALFTTSAIFGVILGLALQDTLGNLFAGISLHADNPFDVGDVISFGPQQQYSGVVEGITWRAVKLRTFQNKLLLVSNSSIAKEAIEVAPRDNLNARIVLFNTRYRDSPAKTIHIVREAVREAENVSQKITPIVRIRQLADSSVDYEVKYWLEDYAKYNDTDALVRQRIWYAFRRNGLTFAYPTRTLRIERPAKTDEVQISNKLIERLSAVDIFAPLSGEEIERLAAASVSHVFAPGETIIRAGTEGSSMFVVHRGRVRVQVTDNGKPRTVAMLNEGEFFGEMALLTGEPRAASVIAIEETEVLEIGHQALKALFEANPDLVETLSHFLAERRAGLHALTAETATDEEESSGFLASIKRFFGFEGAGRPAAPASTPLLPGLEPVARPYQSPSTDSIADRPAPSAQRSPHTSRARLPLSDEEAYSTLAQSGAAARQSPTRETTPDKDPVDCTVFAPPTVAAGDAFFVQVFAHLPQQADTAKELAREFDSAAERRGFRSLDIEVERGSKLMFHLTMQGLEIDDPIQELFWRGSPASVQFGVTVPEETRLKTVIGTVMVSQNNIPIGHIKFKLSITRASRTVSAQKSGPVGEVAHRYEKAFISYASHDRDEVLKRVQMLARLRVTFFQDLLDLEPGERWQQQLYRHIDESDLFLLFWSHAAKESEWVLEEVRYAIKRKGSDEMASPEIIPIILEGPPVVQPPAELAHLHFNDYLIYFMNRQSS